MTSLISEEKYKRVIKEIIDVNYDDKIKELLTITRAINNNIEYQRGIYKELDNMLLQVLQDYTQWQLNKLIENKRRTIKIEDIRQYKYVRGYKQV